MPTAPLWTSIRNPLGNVQGALLLSDGTVMLEEGGDYASNTWFRLTPNATGSYINGTFSALASMNLQRQFFTSDVLPSGKVFVLGGEYTGPSNTLNETNSGEIYDSVANSWTSIANFPLSEFGDAPSEVLTNGTVLGGYIAGPETNIYDPASNTWSPGGTKLRGDQEPPRNPGSNCRTTASCLTTCGPARRRGPAMPSATSPRRIPGWTPARCRSRCLWLPRLGPLCCSPTAMSCKSGPTTTRPYTTPRPTPGYKAQACPGGMGGGDDAPGLAVLPNGHVLFAADSSSPTPYTGPTLLFDYDPGANTITQVATPPFLTLAAAGQGAHLKPHADAAERGRFAH